MQVTTQCIKVAALREKYGKEEALDLWIKRPETLYVGRNTRIFIHRNDEKIRFTPDKSKWHNPYNVPKGTKLLEKSLKRYKNLILMSNLKDDLKELKGKTLGCWCDQSGKCHAKILKELYDLSEKGDLPEPDYGVGGPGDSWNVKKNL